ncbi:MAG: OB-fold nucleic acid binding domain-containing protein [Thermoplasmata archaeon]
MDTVEEYYELVDDIYHKEEFLEKIEETYQESAGLFNKVTIAHMIAAEHGRDTSSVAKIGELESGREATVVGGIVNLGTLRTFQSKRGEGKVRNVRIDDGSGSIKLVLWNEETDMVKDMKIGQTLKVINGWPSPGAGHRGPCTNCCRGRRMTGPFPGNGCDCSWGWVLIPWWTLKMWFCPFPKHCTAWMVIRLICP